MKKKLVILSDDFTPHIRGGAGAVASSDAEELARVGYDVTVITTVQEKSLMGTFREKGMRIERLYAPAYHPRWRAYVSLHNKKVMPQIEKIFRDVQPDIVHTHNVHEYLSYASLHSAKKTGARIFLTAHDVMSVHYGKLDTARRVSAIEQLHEYRLRYNPLRNLFIRKALKNVEKIFAVSNALRRALENNGLQNIEVLYNGVDSHAWRCTDEDARQFMERYSLTHKKTILFSGRTSGAKGGDALLTAFAETVTHVPEAVLLIAGTETDYVRALKARAIERGCGASVISTGWLSHEMMCAAYHASSVVAVPSLYLDPLPTVVLEGMACAKPVVGSNSGGIPEMIQDTVTGVIVDPEDTKAFAAVLTNLLCNDSEAEALGRAGKARLDSVFSTSLHVQRLIENYENA